MGKKATTIEEQMALLKSRGMNLDLGNDKIEEILLDIGYYRLGFYWNPFEKDSDHNFTGGTKFSDAVELYYLDSDLRHHLSKYLNRIEIHFRTQLIYFVSNHYKESPTWFADQNIMGSTFLSELPKYYNNYFIKNNKAIMAHHKKHINDKYAPSWKTLEFLPFGSILAIYRSLKDLGVQKLVSRQYGIQNVKIFKEYIKTLLTVRNICAHGGQLFDFNTPKGIPSIPGLRLDNNERHSFSGVIKLISFFLCLISTNRNKEFVDQLESTLTNASENQVIKEIIETKMGYKIVY